VDDIRAFCGFSFLANIASSHSSKFAGWFEGKLDFGTIRIDYDGAVSDSQHCNTQPCYGTVP
jgi:hypothetical protein